MADMECTNAAVDVISVKWLSSKSGEHTVRDYEKNNYYYLEKMNVKLTEANVREIRREYKKWLKVAGPILAEKYNVRVEHIDKIIKMYVWPEE